MCDVKIRPFWPRNDIELQCEMDSAEHETHQGTVRNYAYPGSVTVITWLTGDRRSFLGEWKPCYNKGCVLPAWHHGNHAF